MPTLYDIKPWFQQQLRPVTGDLAAAGITANQVTLAGLALSGFAGLSVLAFPTSALTLLALPIALFARMALNAIDGMLAREHGQASPLGALLNEVCDLASDAALYLPLALVPDCPGFLVVAAVTSGMIAEGAGLAALLIGSTRRYDGPMGKSDRAFAFGLLAVLLAFGIAGPTLATLALVAITGLSLWTIRNRIVAALAAVGRPAAP